MLQLVNNINYLFNVDCTRRFTPGFDQTNCCDITSESIMVNIHLYMYYIKTYIVTDKNTDLLK